jgi:hypothetical protein
VRARWPSHVDLVSARPRAGGRLHALGQVNLCTFIARFELLICRGALLFRWLGGRVGIGGRCMRAVAGPAFTFRALRAAASDVRSDTACLLSTRRQFS